MTELLEIAHLTKHFAIRGGVVRAVDGVSLALARGETLALVGESGCGKSTVGRCILRLTRPTSGQIVLDGTRIDTLPERRLRPMRRRMQVVFQDPFSSLDPRQRIGDAIAEPLRNFALPAGPAEIAALLDRVGLPAEAARRRPHAFSGGQRQRIGIARALATGPDLLICDEAVSALDVSVKAQIVNLLADLQARLGLALLFISHDLAIVEHLANRVAVMYLGRIVELADRRSVFAAPRHPYTRALLSAVPVPDPTAARRRIVLGGDVPSALAPPAGCRFHPRCPAAFDRCRVEEPAPRIPVPGHMVACHLEVTPPARGG